MATLVTSLARYFLIIDIVFRSAVMQLTKIALMLTIQMINERFRVCAISGAMDGVTPELNPGWVYRRISTFPEVRYAPLLAARVSKAIQMVNECFGMGVMSKQMMAR